MKFAEAGNYICPQTLHSDRKNCLGAECAAWRWAEPKWGPAEQRRGYCGLAGEPRYPLNPANETVGG